MTFEASVVSGAALRLRGALRFFGFSSTIFVEVFAVGTGSEPVDCAATVISGCELSDRGVSV